VAPLSLVSQEGDDEEEEDDDVSNDERTEDKKDLGRGQRNASAILASRTRVRYPFSQMLQTIGFFFLFFWF